MGVRTGATVVGGDGLALGGALPGRPSGQAKRVKAAVEAMPFDVREYLDFEVPGGDVEGDWGP